MLHIALKIVLGLALLAVLHAEWLEIPQTIMKNSSKLKPTIKLVSKSTVWDVYDNSTPSPYWLEYQKQRFSNQDRMKGAQKLVVTAGQHLKNSVKVIVAPMIVVTTTPQTTIPRNQIIHTKMRLNVVDTKLEPPNTEHAHVEMTSRKYTTLHNDEENVYENSAAADSEQQEDENDSDLELFPTVQGFVEFIKSIKKEWMKKAALSINQKIKLLEMLRDNLMHAIDARFMDIWHPQRAHREKRGVLDEANFEFPPEAALMSINFLTFAVFLIKLVLNVVHIIKSKHYNFTGFGTSDVVRNPK